MRENEIKSRRRDDKQFGFFQSDRGTLPSHTEVYGSPQIIVPIVRVAVPAGRLLSCAPRLRAPCSQLCLPEHPSTSGERRLRVWRACLQLHQVLRSEARLHCAAVGRAPQRRQRCGGQRY